MEKLIINEKKQTILVDFKDIISFNATGRYTQVITLSGKYLSCKNLGALEQELPDYFYRIHDSHAINLLDNCMRLCSTILLSYRRSIRLISYT